MAREGGMTALDALYRCQRAWERSQPQLFMELWPDVGLDEREACRPPLVEPAVSPQSPPGGGLTAGAEPCRDTTTGLTALRVHRPEDSPVTALAAMSAGSAPPYNTTGPDAPPAKGARPAQRRSL